MEAGKGGVAIGINMDLITFICAEGITDCHRAVWVCLDHPAWGKIGFAGIYGPNDRVHRAALWNSLSATLDPGFRWHLVGDFNMIKAHCDHVGSTGKIIYGREARAWTNMARKFNLMDTFEQRVGHLRFSWDNQRVHRHNLANVDGRRFGARVLRRIDRFYAPRPSRVYNHTVTSTILPGYALSDHAPILGTFRMGTTTVRPSCHRMNSAHLNDQNYCNRIRSLWEQQVKRGRRLGWEAEKTLASCFQGARRMDRTWGKRRALERRQRREALQDRVTRAQLALEIHPDNGTLQRELAEARERLQALDAGQATWVDKVMQAKWITEGDKCTKVRPPGGEYDFYVEATAGPNLHTVWLFRLPANRLSERWLPFMHQMEPAATFKESGLTLTPVPNCPPTPDTPLRRILVRCPREADVRTHWGAWSLAHPICTQYAWTDGTVLINSSTSQLRLLQERQHAGAHLALAKWTNQLHQAVDNEVWRFTWISYRSAAENTFLWQILYRIPATNKWRHPDLPATDPATWCVRCQLGAQEDLLHCLWAFPNASRCWMWCNRILKWVSCRHPAIQIEPTHILIALHPDYPKSG